MSMPGSDRSTCPCGVANPPRHLMPGKTLKDRALSRTGTGPDRIAEPVDHIGAILDALPALVSYWDLDMRNRVANRAFAEFFGLTPEKIQGRHASEVLGP